MTKIKIKDLNNIYNMLYNMALGGAINGLGARYKTPQLFNEEGELSYILEAQEDILKGYNLGVAFSLDNKKLHLVIYTDYEPKVYTKKDFKQPSLAQGVLKELYRFTQGYSFKNTKKYRGIIREFLSYYTNILELELRGDLVLANRFLKDFNNFNHNEGGWII
jgi:hypothetical protein